MTSLDRQFGQIDIYLFDQLLRGRVTPGMRIFDAGCGYGRNLAYFLREGFRVSGVDADPRAVRAAIELAASIGAAAQFRCEALESISFPGASADFVISSAVLHFALDDRQFDAMLHGSWRMLAPGGVFFCRLASSIGTEQLIQPIHGRRFRLPDGSDRYLVDEPMLMSVTHQLGGKLLDPIKTTVVQNQRSMTTWIVQKT